MSEELFSDVTFASLGLAPELLQGVKDAGFERCTRIQAKALPIALGGRDVAGQAQTGSGKSAAFLLAIFNHLLRNPPRDEHVDGNPRAIVLAPTRELAVQIHKDGEMLGKHTALRLGVVYGGTGYDTQRDMLTNGVDVLIGTPGRFIDYFKQNVFNMKGVQVVVLDEADRMFDLGFIKDIRYLLRRMPLAAERLNMLFSATMSHRVTELAWEHMNAPEIADASSANVTVDTINQVLYHVGSDEKVALLLGLLKRFEAKRTILFTNTRRAAETVCAYLKGNGYESGMLSGDVPQKQRLNLLERFTRGELPILVATDVAARGLHIPEVSHVINYDLPQDPEDYVHRVGRTARVGATGDAVSFACERYVFSLTEIEAFIGQQIPVERISAGLLEKVRRPVFEARERVERRGRGEDENRRGRHAGVALRRGAVEAQVADEVPEELELPDIDDAEDLDEGPQPGNQIQPTPVSVASVPRPGAGVAEGRGDNTKKRRRRRRQPGTDSPAPVAGGEVVASSAASGNGDGSAVAGAGNVVRRRRRRRRKPSEVQSTTG